jgi:hypothetical protein
VPGCANCRERAVPRRARWYRQAGIGFAKSANFGTVSRAKGTVGKRRTRKVLKKNKNGSGAAIKFCRYGEVIDANPADLPH